MGGCCSSTRKAQLHGTPVYYYCSPSLEERESLTSHAGAVSILTAGLVADQNLDIAAPDIYRPPPLPMPFDMELGCPGLTEEPISTNSLRNLATSQNFEGSNCKTQDNPLCASPVKLEVSTPNELESVTEDEDVCPICLEEYDEENPKDITKCQHHFHLSCILEWMERSDACPVCDQLSMSLGQHCSGTNMCDVLRHLSMGDQTRY